jgi:quercetin dioxygenase-like cupin family protein
MNLFENDNLRWKHFTGSDRFDYTIDFYSALLSVRPEGHIELLYWWEPNSYCHFHRHTANTTSLVLKGELQVIDVDLKTGKELGIKIRPVGDFASKEPGDVHMERGGPEGALVFFSLFTEDGSLAETLSQDGRVLSTSSIDPILQRHAN